MSVATMALAGMLTLSQSAAVPAQGSEAQIDQEENTTQLALAPGSVLDPSKVILADNVVIREDNDDDDDDNDGERVVERDRDRDVDVRADVEADTPGNWVGTLALSALGGGLVGALVGTSIYLLERPDGDAINISYWTAGGVLLGVGVGIVQIAVQEDRVSDAVGQRVLDDSKPAQTVGITVPF